MAIRKRITKGSCERMAVGSHRRIRISPKAESSPAPSATSAESSSKTSSHPESRAESKARAWIHESGIRISCAIAHASAGHGPKSPWSCSITSWHILHLLCFVFCLFAFFAQSVEFDIVVLNAKIVFLSQGPLRVFNQFQFFIHKVAVIDDPPAFCADQMMMMVFPLI